MSTSAILHASTLSEVPRLRDCDLELQLVRRSAADARRSWAPAYHFEMRLPTGDIAGWIDLRVGDADEVALYNGHIGYTVRPAYRGRRYAARACRLLFDLARLHGFAELWITCNPDNGASRRTCELAGGEYIETVDLPPENDLFRRGDRQKCRYRFIL
jgi:tagatose 1,6-diphosphate aldolase